MCETRLLCFKFLLSPEKLKKKTEFQFLNDKIYTLGLKVGLAAKQQISWFIDPWWIFNHFL